MKKVVCLFLIIALGLPMFAQDKPEVAPEKNVLKVNALALILTTGSIFYERKLADATSAQLGVGFLSYKIEDAKFHGLILTPEVRLYVKKNAIDGFYAAPYFRFQDFGFENTSGTETSKGSLTTYGGGLAVGRQWIFKKGLAIDFFFGGHYSGSNIKLTSGTDTPDIAKFEGFRMRVGFCLGFAF